MQRVPVSAGAEESDEEADAHGRRAAARSLFWRERYDGTGVVWQRASAYAETRRRAAPIRLPSAPRCEGLCR